MLDDDARNTGLSGIADDSVVIAVATVIVLVLVSRGRLYLRASSRQAQLGKLGDDFVTQVLANNMCLIVVFG